MSKRKNGTLSDGRGYARSGFKLGPLAPLAAVICVAGTVALAGSGPVQAATRPASVVVSGTVIASSGKADAGATVVIHACRIRP